MKNPFHNTNNYMVVREVERINNKKRSYSNSSDSSMKSSNSSQYLNYGANEAYPSCKGRTNREYLIGQARTPAYQIQWKRAQIFGIQELRYRPAYFECMALTKQQQQNKLERQKVFRPGGLKSQRSVKQLKFVGHTPSPLLENNKNPQEKRLSANSTKKRNSLLQQMIELNANHNYGRLNQFYASAMDLRSRAELFKQAKSNTKIHQMSSKIRRNSLFGQKREKTKEQQMFDAKGDSSADEFLENTGGISKQYEKEQFNQKQSGEIPPFVMVRKKVYYKYDKNKIR